MPVKHRKTMCNSQSEQNYVRSKDVFLTKWDAHFVKGEMVHEASNLTESQASRSGKKARHGAACRGDTPTEKRLVDLLVVRESIKVTWVRT